jgi:tripartite-type tricarboxylate transporter receptor subunit TctC
MAPLTVLAILGALFAGHQTVPAAGIIKLIVPVPPGGPNDILARLVGRQIMRSGGGTVVVENRPGAATVVGTEIAARATPDGSTLLITSPPVFTIIPHVQTLTFDPLATLEPVCRLARFPTVIAVNANSPYRTLADLIGSARNKPGELTLAGIGPASLVQVAFETLKRAANVNMIFVPYQGPGLAVNALLGSQITAYFGNYTDVAANLAAGKLRVLAVATRARIDLLPGVPTVAEAGYPGYELDGWFGLFAPAKTPKPEMADLINKFGEAMQDAEVKSKLAGIGLYPDVVCGAGFAGLVHKEYAAYGAIIRAAGIKPKGS